MKALICCCFGLFEEKIIFFTRFALKKCDLLKNGTGKDAQRTGDRGLYLFMPNLLQ